MVIFTSKKYIYAFFLPYKKKVKKPKSTVLIKNGLNVTIWLYRRSLSRFKTVKGKMKTEKREKRLCLIFDEERLDQFNIKIDSSSLCFDRKLFCFRKRIEIFLNNIVLKMKKGFMPDIN